MDNLWKLFYYFTACRIDSIRSGCYCYLYKEKQTEWSVMKYTEMNQKAEYYGGVIAGAYFFVLFFGGFVFINFLLASS